jgi:diketogulonate reductase-like aldo/keto reductase
VPQARVAVAWLLERARRSPTGVVPVMGPRTVEQLDDYVAALQLDMSAEIYDRLDRAGRVPLGQPHEQNSERRLTAVGGEDFRTGPISVA